ncbi:MAG: hypothetical protein QM737_18705 [Ferruginibacter sp.]
MGGRPGRRNTNSPPAAIAVVGRNFMTLLLDQINKRKIIYLDIRDDISEFIKMDLINWVVFVIEDNINNELLRLFAETCIEKNVLYMHATGKACSEVDDLFDFIIVEREVNGGKLPLWMIAEDDVLMTAWDYDFDDAFWFITNTAYYGEHLIDTVIVANMTNDNYLPRIQDLAKKINSGRSF